LPLIFSILLVPVSTTSALDIVSPAEKIENVRTNCSDIKDTVKRVQNSDRNTRVSLGRTYQQILSDFITPMNVRLVKNNRFDYNLNEIQNSFVSAREEFNRNYIYYGQTLETLLATDCKNNPEDFYGKLIEVRNARKSVAESVKNLEGIIDEHTAAVTELKETFRPKEKSDE
jgi:hypothetical protein